MILTNIQDFNTELLSWNSGTTVSYLLVQYIDNDHKLHKGHEYIFEHAKKLSEKVVVQYRPLLTNNSFDQQLSINNITNLNLGEDVSFIDFNDFTPVDNLEFSYKFTVIWRQILKKTQIMFQTTETLFIEELAYKGMMGAYRLHCTSNQDLSSIYNHLSIITPWGGKDSLVNEMRNNIIPSATRSRWVYVPLYYDSNGIIPVRFTLNGRVEASEVLYSLKNILSTFSSFSQLTDFLDTSWSNTQFGGKYYIVDPINFCILNNLDIVDNIYIILVNNQGHVCANDWIGLGNRYYNTITNEFINIEEVV